MSASFRGQSCSLLRQLALASSIFAISLGGAPVAAQATEGDTLDVVFIYSGSARDGGWTETFDNARQKVDEAFGDKVTTSFRESVVEGPQAERVIEAAIQDGADVIVSNSFGFGEPMLKAAAKHPDIYFIASQWDNPGTLENFAGFVNAPEDGAYIAGIAAGHMIEPGAMVGWVDAFPIPYDLRTINGFAIGLAKSNPTATVQVVFTNDWVDTNLQAQATRSLIDSGATFISTSLPSPAIGEVAESRGVPFAAAAIDGSRYAPTSTLTTFSYNWAPALEAKMQSILDSAFDTSFSYANMQDGGVVLTEWGPPYEQLSDEAKAEIDAEIERIKSGTGKVFDGPLTDIDGNEIVATGETLTVGQLRGVDFVMPNVAGVEF